MLNETFSVTFKHRVHLGIALHLMSPVKCRSTKATFIYCTTKVDTRGDTWKNPRHASIWHSHSNSNVENPINIISMCLSHVEKEWKHFCLTPLSTCHYTYKCIHLNWMENCPKNYVSQHYLDQPKFFPIFSQVWRKWKKIHRGPKLEGCAFANFGNSCGT